MKQSKFRISLTLHNAIYVLISLRMHWITAILLSELIQSLQKQNLEKLEPYQKKTHFNLEDILPHVKGTISCEHPNDKIYQFTGSYYFKNQDTTKPLTIDNLILRGSIIRNTEYVLGAVIYTGHSTKVMMSSSLPRTKFTKLEK